MLDSTKVTLLGDLGCSGGAGSKRGMFVLVPSLSAGERKRLGRGHDEGGGWVTHSAPQLPRCLCSSFSL